jgi:Lar family restriction alleviation protein
MNELKPCPFCGGYHVTNVGVTNKAIHCVDCGAYGPEPAYDTNEVDVDWNTRAAPKVKALEWLKLRELCHVSSPCANLEYRVLEQGLDFFVTINGERFGSSNSVGLAQAMAQGHFEKLILEALE